MSNSNNLTSPEYWSQNQEVIKLPQFIQYERNYSLHMLHNKFQHYLPKSDRLRILEIGCSPGAWLIYFNKVFGYQISGLEYTEIGKKLTDQNFKLASVTGTIYQEDIFRTSLPPQSYDVVYSLGLIEHFHDSTEIVKAHARLVKPGGYLVIAVPNIQKAFYGWMQKLLYHEAYEGFVHIFPEQLRSYCQPLVNEVLFCDYAGVMNFNVVNIGKRSMLFSRAYSAFADYSERFAKLIHLSKESRLFSPYVLFIGRK